MSSPWPSWEWWLDRLGNFIRVTDPWTLNVWEGIIWDVDLRAGTYRRHRSLSKLYNRIDVLYSEIPAADRERQTQAQEMAEDADSQDRFGIIEKDEDIGDASQAEAQNMRQMFLEESAWPQTETEGVFPGKHNLEQASIVAAGMWSTLKYRIYEEDTDRATQSMDGQVTDIIDGTDNPGGGELYCQFLDPETTFITLSGNVLPQFDMNNQSAQARLLTLIKSGSGAANYAPYFIGVWQDRKVWAYELPVRGEGMYASTPMWYIDIINQRVYDQRMARVPARYMKAGDLAVELSLVMDTGATAFVIGATDHDAESRVTRIRPWRGTKSLDQKLAEIALRD